MTLYAIRWTEIHQIYVEAENEKQAIEKGLENSPEKPTTCITQSDFRTAGSK